MTFDPGWAIGRLHGRIVDLKELYDSIVDGADAFPEVQKEVRELKASLTEIEGEIRDKVKEADGAHAKALAREQQKRHFRWKRRGRL